MGCGAEGLGAAIRRPRHARALAADPAVRGQWMKEPGTPSRRTGDSWRLAATSDVTTGIAAEQGRCGREGRRRVGGGGRHLSS